MRPIHNRVCGLLAAILVAIGCTPPRDFPRSGHLSARYGSVTVDGVTLPYVIEGTGNPCLVFGSSIQNPPTFSRQFKAALRCVYVGHRGFVASAPAPSSGPFDLDAMVEELESVRGALGLNRFVLVGHSVHGLAVLAYAVRYPQHVSHVIAIGGPPALSAEMARRTREYWETRASPARKAAHARNRARLGEDSLRKLSPGDAFAANYVADAARYWADSIYDAMWLWRGVTVNMPRVNELFDPARSHTLPAAARPLSVPVFIALGRHDYAVPPVLWQDFRGPFSDVSIEIFERSGHFPQFEESAEFDRRVLIWLTQKRQTSSATDPHGDQRGNRPDYRDVVKAQIIKRADSVVFRAEVAGPVPQRPALPPSIVELVWEWLVQSDIREPTGFPNLAGSRHWPELQAQLVWSGSEFKAVIIDRRPTFTGGEVVLKSIPFTIDGVQLELRAAWSEIAMPNKFDWMMIANDWLVPRGEVTSNSQVLGIDFVPDRVPPRVGFPVAWSPSFANSE